MSCGVEQNDYTSLDDVVLNLRPVGGQDLEIAYHCYEDLDLDADETVTGMAFEWRCWTGDAPTALTLEKNTSGGTITITTPWVYVAVTAANLSALTVGTVYYHRLWRVDSGNNYPVTGIGTLIPQYAEPTGV